VLRHSLTGLDCDNPIRFIRHLDEVAQPSLEDCDLCADILSLFRLEHIGKLGFACVPSRNTYGYPYQPGTWDEIARDDFDPSDAVDLWDLVNRQDWSVCEQAWDGMISRIFTADYLASMEQPSADVSRYVTRRLAPGTPGALISGPRGDRPLTDRPQRGRPEMPADAGGRPEMPANAGR
jgi:hypothetical protein